MSWRALPARARRICSLGCDPPLRLWSAERSQLVFGSEVQSCTSSKDNEGLVVARWDQQVAGKSDGDAWPPRDVALARPLLLLDTPGLPALRARVLARSIPQASGVVFVLDPVGGLTSSRIRETADALHLALALVERSRTPIPLLVLLTRADAIAAASRPASINRARAALEREMERRRAALASGGARGPTRLDGLGAQAGAAMLEAEDEAEIVANGRVLEDATAPWSFADACPQATFALVGKGEPLDGFWAWADARQ